MSTQAIAVAADGLGLRTRRGWVYRDVSFCAETNQVTALLGSTGVGKTALLLTLSGRMKSTTGSATVCGLNPARDGALVRRSTGLGLVAGVNDLDDALTAGQHAREALLIRGMPGDTPRSVLARSGLAEQERTAVRDLDIEQRERLGIALGLAGRPLILVVDDVDHDLDVAQQERVMELLAAIAADGVTVLAACISEHTAALAHHTVRLAPPSEDTCATSARGTSRATTEPEAVSAVV